MKLKALFVSCLILSGCSHSYVAIKHGTYNEQATKTLQETLNEAIAGTGATATVLEGPNKELKLSVNGITVGSYITKDNWDLDVAFSFLSYESFKTRVRVQQGMSTSVMSSTYDSSGTSLDLSGGYSFGAFRPFLGLRNNVVIMSYDTPNPYNLNLGKTTVTTRALFALGGMDYRFFLASGDALLLRAEYAHGLTKDDTTESAYSAGLSLGYEWGGRGGK